MVVKKTKIKTPKPNRFKGKAKFPTNAPSITGNKPGKKPGTFVQAKKDDKKKKKDSSLSDLLSAAAGLASGGGGVGGVSATSQSYGGGNVPTGYTAEDFWHPETTESGRVND